MKKVVIVVTIVLLICGVGYYGFSVFKKHMAREMDAIIAEATVFSETTDKEGCVSEFISRNKSCNKISCILYDSAFSTSCFMKAKGSLAEACKPITAPNADSILASKCEENGFDETSCNTLFQFYKAICADAS